MSKCCKSLGGESIVLLLVRTNLLIKFLKFLIINNTNVFSEKNYADSKMWIFSRWCVSSLRRAYVILLCSVPILVYVLPKQAHVDTYRKISEFKKFSVTN